jgi:hypothetical protein
MRFGLVGTDVQAPLAIRAAQAGKHLLLEKPVALSVADADKLAATVEEAGVASVVFFTWRFNTEIRAWLNDEQARGGWSGDGWCGGAAIWLGASRPFSSGGRRAARSCRPTRSTPWPRCAPPPWNSSPARWPTVAPAVWVIRATFASAGTSPGYSLTLRLS